jgi:peptide/nickel transport system ATP-binding protein
MQWRSRMTIAGQGAGALLTLHDVARYFDVSRPWLNRVIERQPRQILKAVDGVSFELRRGETLALVGESGCGKSTVARLIVGLYAATRGEVIFDGVNLASLGRADWLPVRRRVQMIFQDPYASLNPRWRVARIIAEPILVHALATDSGIRGRVDELLQQVGLAPADGEKFAHEFSGGQRQRISVARALASEPEFLICDEPTSALDVSVQAQILNLLKDLQRAKDLTYLFISHNLAVVRHLSDRVAVMYLGRIVELAAKRMLFSTPQHPYTRMLLDALPDIELTGRARTPVAGEVPNPLDPPPGCAFHPRCPYANERCREETPLLKPAAGGQLVACHGVEEARLPVYELKLAPQV